MPVIISQLDRGITRVILSDRIDAAGAVEIAMDLYYVSESSDSVIIDLARVSFIASLGLRNIVSLAKTVFKRGGKVVLLSPQTLVEEVLTTSGITDLIPVYRKQSSAEDAVVCPPSNPMARPDALFSELRLGADVTGLYAWLAEAIAGYGISQELSYRLHVVAEEVVTNVAKHAFPPGQAQPFLVRVLRLADAVELQVRDTGQPFNPVRADTPPRVTDITEIVPGGWGIGLIRHNCPDIRYDRQDGENRLTLRFPLNGA